MGNSKCILIFDQNGELFKTIPYKTKKAALGNYRIFKKYGMLDDCGFVLPGFKFELV